MSSLRLFVLCVIASAAVVLPSSFAEAQDQPPPLGAPGPLTVQVSGTVPAEAAPPPPIGYAPIQVIELPGVYGANTGPQFPTERVGMLQQELSGLQLEYSRYSLGMPITLIVVGGATTVVAGMFFLAYGLIDSVDPTSDSARGVLISGVCTAIGVAVLVGGIVTLVSRVSDRRPYGLRIKEIRRELASYGVRASLDFSPLPSGALLTGTLLF